MRDILAAINSAEAIERPNTIVMSQRLYRTFFAPIRTRFSGSSHQRRTRRRKERWKAALRKHFNAQH